jgi:hypothetical protein
MTEIPGSTGYEYAKFLLQDKQRELQLLEQRLRGALLQPHEYESCRHSLKQALDQLETLLRGEAECRANSIVESCPVRSTADGTERDSRSQEREK